MRKRSTTSLLFLFFTSLLFAQNDSFSEPSPIDTMGLKYYEKGQQFAQSNLDSSIYYLKLAIPFFEKSENWEFLVKNHTNLSKNYYYKRQYEGFDLHSEKAMTLAKRYLDKNNIQYLGALEEISSKWEIKGNWRQTISISKFLINKFRELNMPVQQATNLHNLGWASYQSGELENAIKYTEKAIELFEKNLEKDHLDLTHSNFTIAKYYLELKQPENALAHLEKGKEVLILNKLWAKDYYLSLNYLLQFAESYVALNQNDKAKLYLNKSFDLAKDSLSLILTFQLYGDLMLKEKEYAEAEKYYELFSQYINKQYKHFKRHFRKAKGLENRASLFEAKEDFLKAIQLYQKGLVQVSSDFNDLSPVTNPLLEDITVKIGAKNLLEKKANALYRLYQQTKEVDYLISSFKTSLLANQTIEKIRKGYWASGSKKLLAKNALFHYEKSILVALELFEQTKEEEYLEFAFELMESNKSNLLLESLQNNLARGLVGIPDSLISNEKLFIVDINFYKEQLAKEAARIVKKEEKIIQYKEKLFTLENSYEGLVKKLEQNYPKYYQLKYDFSTPTLSKIQKSLDVQEQMIEYFIGEEKLIIFSITKEKVAIQKYPLTEHLNAAINQLLDLVKNGPTLQNQQADFSSFVETAHQLYQQLIAPVLDAKTNKLLIIPDDQLNYLPFELLLTSAEAKEDVVYANLPYLFKKVAINYHYSANLYERTKNTKQPQGTQSFVGFAPSFGESMIAQTRNCIGDELYSLNCAQKELENIAAQINGSQSIIGINATKDKFSKEAANGRILHLATHACINEENPMLSKIYFADDYLTYYDLNNLELNADLAVLSACNTGSGKLEKGEGVISIAKGFIQAGVPSVVTSLWSVDDCATSDIMTQFYKYLKEGQTKDKALRNAKLMYLQTADKAHAHPFYWGAFVQFGNTDSLDYLSEGNPRTRFLLIGLVGLILFILERKARLKK